MRTIMVTCIIAGALMTGLTDPWIGRQECQAVGGFSGGTFHGGGGYVEGPRGGAIAEGPWGGTAARTPDGTAIMHSPGGAAGVRTPSGDFLYRGARGAVVADLPVGAMPVLIDGQNYYFAEGVYYQPCYVGNELNYCVVDFGQ